MWPRTNLIDLLGITHPIIQAPMGGFTTPQLAAAVCNAGALGSLAVTPLPAAAAREQVAATRQATNRPFNVNFFVHAKPSRDAGTEARARQRVARYFDEFGLGPVPEVAEPFLPFDDEGLQLVLEMRPRIVSFHFGLPEPDATKKIKSSGAVVLSSATTVTEARALEAAGADAIIAQGWEAGGHRGTFTSGSGAGAIGTLALVPQVVDAVRVPVIAAGGIADGRGIAAAFALGASGVQIGTAFLRCPEASVLPLYRDLLKGATDESTELTRAFSGRPARALRNRLAAELSDADALPFPLQASLTAPIWRLGGEEARRASMPVWAGQAAALARDMPAGALVEKLVDEAQAILRR